MTEKQGGSDLRANTHRRRAGRRRLVRAHRPQVVLHAPGVRHSSSRSRRRRAGITCFVAERPHPGLPPPAPEGQARRPLPGLQRGRVRPPARAHPRRGGPRHRVHDRADHLDAARHDDRRRRDDAAAAWPRRSGTPATAARSARCSPTQPAMQNVLADLALESEAMTASRACGSRAPTTSERRAAVPALRAGGHEVLDLQARRRRSRPRRSSAWAATATSRSRSMAQFYRDIQIGTVWEGSGNVARARRAARDGARAGGTAGVHGRVRARGGRERASRRAPGASAAELHAPDSGPFAADAEWTDATRRGPGRRATGEPARARCAAGGRRRLLRRPAGRRRRAFGTLPRGADPAAIVERALAT